MARDPSELVRWARLALFLVPLLWWLLGRARASTRRPSVELRAGEQPTPKPIEPR
jgi:hypothetical protein